MILKGRKNLRLSSCEIDITEETIGKKNDSIIFGSPSLKKSIDSDTQCKIIATNINTKCNKVESSSNLSPKKASNNLINRNDTDQSDIPMDTCELLDQTKNNQKNKENNDKFFITID